MAKKTYVFRIKAKNGTIQGGKRFSGTSQADAEQQLRKIPSYKDCTILDVQEK